VWCGVVWCGVLDLVSAAKVEGGYPDSDDEDSGTAQMCMNICLLDWRIVIESSVVGHFLWPFLWERYCCVIVVCDCCCVLVAV
jgi:hypothetical protein